MESDFIGWILAKIDKLRMVYTKKENSTLCIASEDLIINLIN